MEWHEDYETLAGLLVDVAKLHEQKTGILSTTMFWIMSTKKSYRAI